MKKRIINIPTTIELEQELTRENYKSKYKKLLKSTIYVLMIVVSISVVIATFLFPVLQIYGESMQPNLKENDIVLCMKKSKYKIGDVIAFYYNNKILVKRVIGISSNWINIDLAGNVYVDDKLLSEFYLEEKLFGESDIKYPYQVPEDSYFVLGDNRETSIDSRSSMIGTISDEQIIGKVVFRVWPLKQIGIIK